MNDNIGRAGPYPKDVKPCRGCDADIVWMKTKKSKWMCVNVVPTKSEFRGPRAGEMKYVHGEHEPHWATCKDPKQFRCVRITDWFVLNDNE